MTLSRPRFNPPMHPATTKRTVRRFLVFSCLFASLWQWFSLSPAPAMERGIDRAEIQHFFTSDDVNSIRNPLWLSRYLGREVSWRGEVAAIRHRPSSLRVEIMIKVLPDSLLYDTVAVLEGNTTLNPAIRKKSRVAFTGKIFNGVDSFGVKEVQVLLRDPGRIRLEETVPARLDEEAAESAY